MKETIIDIDEKGRTVNVKPTTPNYHLVKPNQEDFYDVDDHNSNMDIIDTELHTQAEQIKDLSSPYVIPEGTDFPIKDRKKGKMYFKVTSRQSGGGTNETIKVSPTMGLKIQ